MNSVDVQLLNSIEEKFKDGSHSATDKTNMPIVKYPRTIDPLWYEWDRKAQKCGLRHTVYAVNGDRYTGEWLDNMKHGKGTQWWKRTGAIYSGDWRCGRREGYGTYSLPDPITKEYKKVYAGWWKNDKMWKMKTDTKVPGRTGRKTGRESSSIWTQGSSLKGSGWTICRSVEP